MEIILLDTIRPQGQAGTTQNYPTETRERFIARSTTLYGLPPPVLVSMPWLGAPLRPSRRRLPRRMGPARGSQRRHPARAVPRRMYRALVLSVRDVSHRDQTAGETGTKVR